MRNLEWVSRIAGDDNVTIISSCWCRNRTGICLSFAVLMDVMDVDDISEFCKMFMRAVDASYKSLISQYFMAKSTKPLVCATDSGELVMLWSFQGDDDKATADAIGESGIMEI